MPFNYTLSPKCGDFGIFLLQSIITSKCQVTKGAVEEKKTKKRVHNLTCKAATVRRLHSAMAASGRNDSIMETIYGLSSPSVNGERLEWLKVFVLWTRP